MTPMKTISVTEFKAHCLEFVNQVNSTGEPVLLTKRGKPTAMVTLPPPATGKGWKLGLFKDQGRIVGDIIAPSDEPWEALL